MSRPFLLIVDDDKADAALAARWLKGRWEVKHVVDLHQANAVVRHRRPDVVLLDARLPGLFGHLAGLDWLTQQHPGLSIVMWTGMAEADAAGYHRDAVSRGAYTVLVKADAAQYLEAALESAMQRQKWTRPQVRDSGELRRRVLRLSAEWAAIGSED